MTKLEKIARDLASVLSPKGEADWQRFVGMAEVVGTRLFKQFADIISPEAESIERQNGRHEFRPR